MIIKAWTTKTPFIIDSMVRGMTVMFAVALIGGVLAIFGGERVFSGAVAVGMMSMLPVVYLSLKQGERNRGPMPTFGSQD